MNKTGIEWTDFTANPLKYRRKSDGKVVWACVKTSPGCAHCYAEQIALRFEHGKLFTAANMEEVEPFLDEAELRKMLGAKTVGGQPVSGSKCFVGDMTDIFGEWVPDAMLDRLFAAMALRSDVTWQLLTKRPERMRDYLRMVQDDDKDLQRFANAACDVAESPCAAGLIDGGDWPLPGVWLGISVEDQPRADERISLLQQTPAAVRFLSCEPLLSAVDLTRVAHGRPGRFVDILGGDYGNGAGEVYAPCPRIDWVVVGGEWPRRPADAPGLGPPDHRRLRRRQGAVLLKQIGSRPTRGSPSDFAHFRGATVPGSSDRRLADPKGGDMAEWPMEFRVRQFPEATP